jgi:hypothetical protein
MTDGVPMESKAVGELKRAVERADAIRERLGRMTHDPRPGSQAAIDAAIPHARWIQMSASVALAVASDHLTSWKLIVDGRVIPIYSPMTLLRAALEGAVMCRWLVDRRPGSRDRVARGLAAQLADYDERRKWEVAIGAPERPPSAGKSGADRRADLVTARDSDGIPIVRLPGATDLARGFGAPGYRDISGFYRLMSAFAHAKPWALHATELGPAVPTAVPGVHGGRVTSSDAILVRATHLVAGLVETAVMDLEWYLGVDGLTANDTAT